MHLFREERILGSIDNAARAVSYTHLNQKTDKAINKNNAVGINISLGSTGWKDHAEAITEETKGSRITAGRTAAVIALSLIHISSCHGRLYGRENAF